DAGEPGKRVRYRARHPRRADGRTATRRVDPPRPRPSGPLQLGTLRPRGARDLPGRGAGKVDIAALTVLPPAFFPFNLETEVNFGDVAFPQRRTKKKRV